MNIQKKPIVLIGFMGVGKSSVGKILATKLKRKWIDMDQTIEQKFDMNVETIFHTYGEKTFRETERKFISQFLRQSSTVISTGGGSFLQMDVQKKCMEKGFVIFLDITWDSWKKRLPLLKNRPLLQGKSEQDIKELFFSRKSIYSSHHLKIDTDGLNINEIADAIFQKLKEKNKDCPK
ncbi:shikimate kinase [Fervidibacillus halotolerans]|uniref:Shikimate kinase n=1 Tax=Fervidibacillus halotolerans TaxID=2980027 RepID=A0A9E8M127_9BACI|nr:shikimate kinase [Fervidibacillus halotolerans]WAA12950.1 shikimate kinase [Fervidibacillus halotolerans]